ncbi:MAG: hypothetical protein OES41_00110 [Rhodospirillales bacterium]|nr:hypothetical protein [Rhodospirillales bacterium]
MPTDAEHDSSEGASTGASAGVKTGGEVGPFVTWVARLHADGGWRAYTSRRRRKDLGPLAIASPDIDPTAAAAAVGHEWHRFWAPPRLGWWIAVLFMIGSALFALGGALATWPHAPALQWIDQALIAWVFFVGALFFTAAAYLQWLEALNNDVTNVTQPNGSGPRRWRFLGWRPRNLGYLAASVQLVGTVLFNFNTADALIAGLGWEGQDLVVWTPDILGSICFLVASQLAVMEVSHYFWSFQPRILSWWITVINLLGSVLFMISAVASFVEPGAVMASPWLANFGTFAGAVCFFVGAYLLIPELFDKAPSPMPAGAVA